MDLVWLFFFFQKYQILTELPQHQQSLKIWQLCIFYILQYFQIYMFSIFIKRLTKSSFPLIFLWHTGRPIFVMSEIDFQMILIFCQLWAIEKRMSSGMYRHFKDSLKVDNIIKSPEINLLLRLFSCRILW